MADQSFPFIVSNGPRVPRDPSIRTMIRKQAMKDVGIQRKSKRNPGRMTIRQSPVLEDAEVTFRRPAVIDEVASTDEAGRSSSRSSSGASASSLSVRSSSSPDSSSSSSSSSSESDLVEVDELSPPTHEKALQPQLRSPDQSLSGSIRNNLSFNRGYDLVRMKYGIDIPDLSILTNFNVNKGAIGNIWGNPARLATLMCVKRWSYLDYIPSRYGSTECLTITTECVLARMQEVLSPNGPSSPSTACNMLYGRALRSLQKAIAAEETNQDADVLGATQLLVLYELLDPTRDNFAWAHHMSGSARLITYRSSKRFTTDFEKALFSSHVGGMVSLGLVGNQHCYLEQPEWMDVYASTASESLFLTDRSPLAVNLRKTLFRVPGVWRDTGDWVNTHRLFDDKAPPALVKRCEDTHQDLVDWLEDYKNHTVSLSLVELPPEELQIRRELYGSALECSSIIKRVLATLKDDGRLQIEEQNQELVDKILDLQGKPVPPHSWLFTPHEIGVSEMFYHTTDQWREDTTQMFETDRKLAIRKRYNTWSNFLRASDHRDTRPYQH
ncbi:Hypothetical protein R9X50_00545900 [Acrodontium crateriforme]|uniref:Uncharacterized protein n=1 Tax=Acrodontium crateriforme TaxID=150365 RepID=A0AAQ3R947_9PEZI|nr:Hypothetical protein R9X50_00545900 [Acrodontium crateriforme]